MIGVSPAFFISKYGTEFSPEQMASSLGEIASLGFEAFQPEVYLPERLGEWCSQGARRVADAAHETGLTASQFVAHFLLHAFEDRNALRSGFGVEELADLCRSLDHLPGCDLVTVPLPAFATAGTETAAEASALRERLIEKLLSMHEAAVQFDKRLALEIMPYSLIGGVHELATILNELDAPRLGYNFDTGHAWSSKELVELIPLWFGGRLVGTHLCDNDGAANASLAPGEGNIAWDRVIGALTTIGYAGSFDVEIRCAAEHVSAKYLAARQFFEHYVSVRREERARTPPNGI